MGDSPGHLGTADLPACLGGAEPRRAPVRFAELGRTGSNRPRLYLLVETILLTTAVILAIKVAAQSSLSSVLWLVAPAFLAAAALVPVIVRRARFAEIGLNVRQIKLALPVLCRTCLVVFGATFAGLWLLKWRGLEPPLPIVLPQNQQWLSYLFYQFMYVAVAEEVFFRGYVQNNILRAWPPRQGPLGQGLTSTIKCGHGAANWISIVLSAACFAAAHIIIQGQIIAVLTFLPGLILAYLFIRTRSLLAPILFHGLANTLYAICTAALA